MTHWNPIKTAPKVEGQLVLLWAEGVRVAAWEWDEGNNRWNRESGLHWAEGEYGPTDWMEMPAPAVRSVIRVRQAA